MSEQGVVQLGNTTIPYTVVRSTRRKQFVSGESLPYLGHQVRLFIERAGVRQVSVRFAPGTSKFPFPHASPTTSAAPRSKGHWSAGIAGRRPLD